MGAGWAVAEAQAAPARPAPLQRVVTRLEPLLGGGQRAVLVALPPVQDAKVLALRQALQLGCFCLRSACMVTPCAAFEQGL